MRVLYISYDGILEGLGRSQVWGYLRRLAGSHAITLITFEKDADWLDAARRDLLRDEAKRLGIRWVRLRYHRKGALALIAVYEIVCCIAVALYLGIRQRIEIVHSRSYPAAVPALILKKLFGIRFIFDMRGFWVEERDDAGLWKGRRLLRSAAKFFETKFLQNADVIVSLTRAGVEELKKFPCFSKRSPRFEVITTCADLERFSPGQRTLSGAGGAFTLGYVGTATGWYLFDPVARSFKLLLAERPEARLLVINKGEHEYIRSRLAAQGIDMKQVEMKAVDYDGVAAEMRRMDAAVFFIKPVFSKKASSPTKLGELLACGVPCLSNSGIGDMDAILEEEGVGALVGRFDEPGEREAVQRLVALALDGRTRGRCVEAARKHFSLQDGVAAYDRIYRSLAGRGR